MGRRERFPAKRGLSSIGGSEGFCGFTAYPYAGFKSLPPANHTERREAMSLYCIEFTRELEDKEVIHVHFDHEPTRDEVIKAVNDEGFHYDDDYGKLQYYPVAGI